MKLSVTTLLMVTVMVTASFGGAAHAGVSARCEAAAPAVGRIGQLYVSPGNHHPAAPFRGAAQL